MKAHFDAFPAPHRFLVGPYPDFRPNVVSPGSLRCFVRVAAGNLKFALLGAALRMTGRQRLARKVEGGWKVNPRDASYSNGVE